MYVVTIWLEIAMGIKVDGNIPKLFLKNDRFLFDKITHMIKFSRLS